MNRLCFIVFGWMLCFTAFGKGAPLVKVGGAGRVAIVNACFAPTNALNATVQKFADAAMIECEVKSGEWRLAAAKECFEAAKANAAVFIVRDESLPMSLVAVESKWGVVNAAGLDEKGLACETLRVMALVLGCSNSRYAASAMHPVFAVADLDKGGDVLAVDTMMAISASISNLGIKPYRMMPRADAIEEGLLEPAAAGKDK